MHLTSQDLEDFEELLESAIGGTGTLSPERVGHLLKMVRAERWARANHSRADKARIAEAEAAGRVSKSTFNPVAARMPATWTGNDKPARLRPQTPIAKTGDQVLASLGLNLGEDE
jgi:hypothetical protein